MPWGYCSKCNNNIGPPSPYEIGLGAITCDCGEERPLGQLELALLLSEIVERLDDLERER